METAEALPSRSCGHDMLRKQHQNAQLLPLRAQLFFRDEDTSSWSDSIEELAGVFCACDLYVYRSDREKIRGGKRVTSLLRLMRQRCARQNRT